MVVRIDIKVTNLYLRRGVAFTDRDDALAHHLEAFERLAHQLEPICDLCWARVSARAGSDR